VKALLASIELGPKVEPLDNRRQQRKSRTSEEWTPCLRNHSILVTMNLQYSNGTLGVLKVFFGHEQDPYRGVANSRRESNLRLQQGSCHSRTVRQSATRVVP
jgi:hypothetical protein